MRSNEVWFKDDVSLNEVRLEKVVRLNEAHKRMVKVSLVEN